MVQYNQAQQLLFVGSAIGLISGLVLSLTDPVAGFLLSSITVVLGIVVGGIEFGKSAKEKTEVLLSDEKEREAAKWGSMTILFLILFVLSEVYVALALVMFALALIKYYDESLEDRVARDKAAFRAFVGLILLAAYYQPSLALLPVAVVGFRFILALAPEKIEKGVREVYS